MTIGPLPMMRIVSRSVRFGMQLARRSSVISAMKSSNR